MNNPDDKMLSYARRMQELINEAYADGILLTTMLEDPVIVMPNQSDYKINSVAVPVPVKEHSHPHLYLPQAVKATAISKNKEDGTSEIVPANLLPKPVHHKIVPVFNDETQHCFVSTDLVQPWLSENDILTSALKFGEKFDLLGLSTTNKTQPTDLIRPGVVLEAIWYRKRDGEIVRLETYNLPFSCFSAYNFGDYRDQSIEMPIRIVCSDSESFNRTEAVYITVTGVTNLQFGSTKLEVTGCEDTGIQPLGYTLRAERVTPYSAI